MYMNSCMNRSHYQKKITIDILKTTFKDASTFNQEMQADNMVSFIQFKLMLSLAIYRVFKCS